MLQRLFGRNAIFRIVNKDPLQKVQEQPVEVGITLRNILGRLILASMASTLHHLSNNAGFNPLANDALHHGQVLQIIVSLEKCIAGEELNENAANTPDVTGETPTQIENDLRCPVMSSGDNRRVVLVIEGGRSKINQSNLTIQEDASLTCCPRCCMRGGWDCSVVGERLIRVVHEQDVLGFKVGVDEVKVMED